MSGRTGAYVIATIGAHCDPSSSTGPGLPGIGARVNYVLALLGSEIASQTGGGVVRHEGLEPSTCGLRVRCSTIELAARLMTVIIVPEGASFGKTISVTKRVCGRVAGSNGRRRCRIAQVRLDAVRRAGSAPALVGATTEAPSQGRGFQFAVCPWSTPRAT